ncbi:MAG: AbrB/MazE/SpoVT family DNA-binding domain-containing protein [Oscillospiraceae bacterium]|nr:AbrB/MazE/SpoVT family DNA-binding domain-containing protein [Oscillospiraceae bacterium]
MKATGIVRKIDDLGRVVIPKELRRTLRIRDGDPLEIFTERDGEVIFKKYSPMGELGEYAAGMCETLGKSAGVPCVITDRDCVIAVHGAGRRELVGKTLSEACEKLISSRKSYVRGDKDKPVAIIDGAEKYTVNALSPILSEGDILGSVAFISDSGAAPQDFEGKLAATVAGFLGKQMES